MKSPDLLTEARAYNRPESLGAVNALKALCEGHTDECDNYAPGFIDRFLDLGPEGRNAVMNQLMANLGG